eukprot:364779-Chlamydomonas_euryale.AAC.7
MSPSEFRSTKACLTLPCLPQSADADNQFSDVSSWMDACIHRIHACIHRIHACIHRMHACIHRIHACIHACNAAREPADILVPDDSKRMALAIGKGSHDVWRWHLNMRPRVCFACACVCFPGHGHVVKTSKQGRCAFNGGKKMLWACKFWRPYVQPSPGEGQLLDDACFSERGDLRMEED